MPVFSFAYLECEIGQWGCHSSHSVPLPADKIECWDKQLISLYVEEQWQRKLINKLFLMVCQITRVMLFHVIGRGDKSPILIKRFLCIFLIHCKKNVLFVTDTNAVEIRPFESRVEMYVDWPCRITWEIRNLYQNIIEKQSLSPTGLPPQYKG